MSASSAFLCHNRITVLSMPYRSTHFLPLLISSQACIRVTHYDLLINTISCCHFIEQRWSRWSYHHRFRSHHHLVLWLVAIVLEQPWVRIDHTREAPIRLNHSISRWEAEGNRWEKFGGRNNQSSKRDHYHIGWIGRCFPSSWRVSIFSMKPYFFLCSLSLFKIRIRSSRALSRFSSEIKNRD